MKENATLSGGCLCGAVRYCLTAPPKVAANCHCSMCRRHSGAAYLTYTAVERSTFRIERGEMAFHRSSGDAVRSHCGTCGSPLTFVFDSDPDVTWVTAGTLDNPDLIAPTEDWFVRDKVRWTTLDHALTAWPGAPEV